MEDQNINQSLFNLQVNENTKTQLKGAAIVAGVAAILSLVSAVLSFVKIIMDKNKPAIDYNYEGFNRMPASMDKSGNIVGGVISLIISILLFYFLNKFSGQTKLGVNGSNPDLVNSGFSGLSAYFVTIGILLIIVLAFMVLAILAR